jgi:F0F1-type ATP synthase membrane subunit c/vacuolar-type H+-ATPase subunit K
MPAIHAVSVVHLCLVAAFLGLYLCEAVVEGSHAKDELHPTAIRLHFLLDVFVEVPLMIGILVTGIILSFLVEEITTPHVWLIACGTIVVFSCLFCFLRFVRTRRKLLDVEVIDHARLGAIRRNLGIFTFAFLNPALIVALVVGFWLAHRRAIEAFCL